MGDLIVRNVIRECYDGHISVRPVCDVDSVVFHRISRAEDPGSPFGSVPDFELSGQLVAAWFREHGPQRPGSYTGGETPYTGLVRVDGSVDQMLGAADQGAHATRWNYRGLGIAFAGDFRAHAPSEAQVSAAVFIAAMALCAGWRVHTHDEVRDEPKGCPGDLWPQDKIMKKAREIAAVRGACSTNEALRRIGFVI